MNEKEEPKNHLFLGSDTIESIFSNNDETNKLQIFLKEKLQEGTVHFKEGREYKYSEGTVSFSNDVYARKRKDLKIEKINNENKDNELLSYRFEIAQKQINQPAISGGFGKMKRLDSVFGFNLSDDRIKPVLKLYEQPIETEEDQLNKITWDQPIKEEPFEKQYKETERILKEHKTKDELLGLNKKVGEPEIIKESFEKEYKMAKKSTHLSIKKPGHIKDSTSFMLMDRMKGKTFNQTVGSLKGHDIKLQPEEFFLLCKTMLESFDNQVVSKNLIHGDLNFDNIFVHMSYPQNLKGQINFDVNIIDYGTSGIKNDPKNQIVRVEGKPYQLVNNVKINQLSIVDKLRLSGPKLEYVGSKKFGTLQGHNMDINRIYAMKMQDGTVQYKVVSKDMKYTENYLKMDTENSTDEEIIKKLSEEKLVDKLDLTELDERYDMYSIGIALHKLVDSYEATSSQLHEEDKESLMKLISQMTQDIMEQRCSIEEAKQQMDEIYMTALNRKNLNSISSEVQNTTDMQFINLCSQGERSEWKTFLKNNEISSGTMIEALKIFTDSKNTDAVLYMIQLLNNTQSLEKIRPEDPKIINDILLLISNGKLSTSQEKIETIINFLIKLTPNISPEIKNQILDNCFEKAISLGNYNLFLGVSKLFKKEELEELLFGKLQKEQYIFYQYSKELFNKIITDQSLNINLFNEANRAKIDDKELFHLMQFISSISDESKKVLSKNADFVQYLTEVLSKFEFGDLVKSQLDTSIKELDEWTKEGGSGLEDIKILNRFYTNLVQFINKLESSDDLKVFKELKELNKQLVELIDKIGEEIVHMPEQSQSNFIEALTTIHKNCNVLINNYHEKKKINEMIFKENKIGEPLTKEEEERRSILKDINNELNSSSYFGFSSQKSHDYDSINKSALYTQVKLIENAMNNFTSNNPNEDQIAKDKNNVLNACARYLLSLTDKSTFNFVINSCPGHKYHRSGGLQWMLSSKLTSTEKIVGDVSKIEEKERQVDSCIQINQKLSDQRSIGKNN